MQIIKTLSNWLSKRQEEDHKTDCRKYLIKKIRMDQTIRNIDERIYHAVFIKGLILLTCRFIYVYQFGK